MHQLCVSQGDMEQVLALPAPDCGMLKDKVRGAENVLFFSVAGMCPPAPKLIFIILNRDIVESCVR